MKKLNEIRKKIKVEAFVGLFLLVTVVACGVFLLPSSPTNDNDIGQAVATLPPVVSDPVPANQDESASSTENGYDIEPAYYSDYSGDNWNSGEINNPINPEQPIEEPEEEVDPGDIEPVDPTDPEDPEEEPEEEPEDPTEDPTEPEEPIEEPVDPGDIEDPGFEEEIPEDIPDDIEDWING